MYRFSKHTKPMESFQLTSMSGPPDDFTLIESEWENLQTRNIAFSAVIFDEFLKELAAICQEHCVLTHDH